MLPKELIPQRGILSHAQTLTTSAYFLSVPDLSACTTLIMFQEPIAITLMEREAYVYNIEMP
jgi:hypothetical protein